MSTSVPDREVLNQLRTQLANRDTSAIADGVTALVAALSVVKRSDATAADAMLTAAWQTADMAWSRQVLVPALADWIPGPALLQAWLLSADGDDHITANAAVELLCAAARSASLESAVCTHIWRRLSAVARRHRADRLPEVAAAAALARQGPADCLATVALTAFRNGPEDADDRLVALACLGRFADPRVLPWLLAALATGAASLEALAALARWIERADAGLRASQADGLRGLLEAALLRHGSDPGDCADAWQRWSTLRALASLLGQDALAHVVGAWQAVGTDDPPWYGHYLACLAAELADDGHIAGGDLTLAETRLSAAGACPFAMPILPSPRESLLARSPRIGRQAVASSQDCPAAGPEIADLIAKRAAIEAALVRRGQLIASFLRDPSGEPGDVDLTQEELAPWAPWSRQMGDAERAQLAAEESRWIDG